MNQQNTKFIYWLVKPPLMFRIPEIWISEFPDQQMLGSFSQLGTCWGFYCTFRANSIGYFLKSPSLPDCFHRKHASLQKQTASTFRLWLDAICINVNTLNNVVISFLRASRLIWTSDSQLEGTPAIHRGLISLERTSYPFQRHAAVENPSAWPETKSQFHVPIFKIYFRP